MPHRSRLITRPALIALALGLVVFDCLPTRPDLSFSAGARPALADDDGPGGGGGGGRGGGGGAGAGAGAGAGGGVGRGGDGEGDRSVLARRGSGRFTNPFRGFRFVWPWRAQRPTRVARVRSRQPIFVRVQPPTVARVRPRPPILAQTAPRTRRELLGSGLREPELASLRAEGFIILAQRALGRDRGVIARLAAPRSLSNTRALERLRAIAPGRPFDQNHLFSQSYRAQGGRAALGRAFPEPLSAVGWPAPAACASPLAIGLVDTAIDPLHPGLKDKPIDRRVLRSDDRAPASARHGSAVASLILGDGAFPGLLPSARLVAVDAFHRSGGADRIDAFDLASALDLLGESGVDIVNLSLAGPENAVVDAIGRDLSVRGIVVVAASGNNGPGAGPLYPAAHDWAVAVTAIDGDRRLYARANRGPHVEIAAPGVDLALRDETGRSRTFSGTSFATPFVTARLALALAAGADRPESTPAGRAAEATARVIGAALDLGPPGRDDGFGSGLVQFGGACPRTAAAP